MGLYKMLDPDENMDLCCFGAMNGKKGVMIIGSLEIIGVLASVANIVAFTIGDINILLLVAASIIALANIVTILLMFYGVKKGQAFMVSAHLIVHVVNIISLVFALLKSSMFLVATPPGPTSVMTATVLAPVLDPWGNVKWAVQLSIITICLILETWFFNVEYTVFLQLCDRKTTKYSFVQPQNPKGAVYG